MNSMMCFYFHYFSFFALVSMHYSEKKKKRSPYQHRMNVVRFHYFIYVVTQTIVIPIRAVCRQATTAQTKHFFFLIPLHTPTQPSSSNVFLLPLFLSSNDLNCLFVVVVVYLFVFLHLWMSVWFITATFSSLFVLFIFSPSVERGAVLISFCWFRFPSFLLSCFCSRIEEILLQFGALFWCANLIYQMQKPLH